MISVQLNRERDEGSFVPQSTPVL